MSKTAYNELITKTFRDNAIRSVLMIDDEYLRYDELLDRVINKISDPLPTQIISTQRAVSIHDFFRRNIKITCDIDNGIESIDAEKIRKSDLIILDYHLEKDDPRKSIELICQLQNNDHMNLVILYTRENLDKVWLALAANMRTKNTIPSIAQKSCVDEADGQSEWDQLTEHGTDITGLTSQISISDLTEYVLTNDVLPATKKAFGQTYKKFAQYLRRRSCEKLIEDQSLSLTSTKLPLFGNSKETKWIQSGNVFVALHAKSLEEGEDEPAVLWHALTAALHDWCPSYYQLAISEIQNSLENECLSFDSFFSNDLEGQAAWLSKMLCAQDLVETNHLSIQLFERLVEGFKNRLLEKQDLLAFHSCSVNALSNIAKEGEMAVDLVAFSALHVGLTTKDLSYKSNMFHALNANLCSTLFTGKYITNGTVLREIINATLSKWYLCVSPACDTVPHQIKGALATRLSPDRLLKLITLTNVNLTSALENATTARNIFIQTLDGKRFALSVQDSNDIPEIEYALIHNHKTIDIDIAKNGMTVSFLHRDEEKTSHLKETKLIPVCQLRDSYAARYQTAASHHLGRVGVDYVKYSAK